MAAAKSRKPDPLPLPASLSDHRGIKREMISLYRQAKRGLVDPALLGRLAHLLSLIAGLVRDVELEARIAKLEAAAASEPEGEPWQVGNGAGRHAARH